MDFNPMHTQNWTRAFQVWIDDIHIACHPIMSVPLRDCVLGRIRNAARYASLGVMVLFALHCTSPVAAATRETAKAQGEAPSQGRPLPTEPFTEGGMATWYGGPRERFRGRRTASGDVFQPEEYTCAHRTLPFGTLLLVENVRNGRRAVVRVNDRGPFVRGRMIDLSYRAANRLEFLHEGVTRVRIRPLRGPETARTKGRPFTVQLASPDAAAAVRAARELRGDFGRVSWRSMADAGGRALRVAYVGSFATMEDARGAADSIGRRLRDHDVEPFVIRRY